MAFKPEVNYYPITQDSSTKEGTADAPQTNMPNVADKGTVKESGGSAKITQNSIQSVNYVSGQAGWYLSADGILRAVGAVISGTITATAGTIGGWTITSTTIVDTAGLVGLSSAVTAGDDIRIWAGHATPASAPFYVTEAGALVATSATITGAITATSGAIGGWTVGADYIRDAAGAVGMSSAVTGGDDIRFWAGDATPGSAEFRVTEAGALVATSATITGSITATSGDIGGWVITSGYIYNLQSGTPTSTPSDGLVLASGNEGIIVYENTEKRVELGYLSAGVYGVKGYAADGTTPIFEISDTQQIIGGWTFDNEDLYRLASGTPSASPSDGIVIDGSATPVITCYENTEKRLEVGYLSAGIYGIKGYDDDGSTVLFELSDTQKLLNGSILLSDSVNGLALKIGNQSWSHDLVFSVTDADTVAWASGTITMADGSTTYAITGANTGNMAARTFVYLDIASSTTVLQTTTTASTAVGDGKVLIAVAENSTTEATYQVFGGVGGLGITGGDIENLSITASQITANTITASEIASNTITANEIAANTVTASEIAAGTITTTEIAANTIVAGNIAAGTITGTEITGTTLSAIYADLGTITAGTITGGTIRTASSGSRVEMTGSRLSTFKATTEVIRTGELNGFLDYVSSEYGIAIGEATKYFKYDPTNGLRIAGTIETSTFKTAGEDLTQGDSIQIGGDATSLADSDSHISASNPTTNYGTATELTLIAGNTSLWELGGAGTCVYGLIQFDLSELDSTIAGNVASAVLYVNASTYNYNSRILYIQRLTTTWTASTVTWNTKPTRTGTDETTITLTGTGWATATLTTLVTGWLDGTYNKYGIAIQSLGPQADGGITLYSSDSAGNEPYLLITFTSGKVYKATAVTSNATGRWLGFCTTTTSAESTVPVQVAGNATYLSSLTTESPYYQSDTRGAIATSAGTVSKKIGLSLSTTEILILNS